MSYMFKSFWSFFSLICFFSVLISFYSLYSCSLIIHHLYLLLSLFIEQCIIFLFLKFLFGYSWYISLYSFCRDFSGFVKTSCVCFSDVSLITYWNILMAHACSVSQSCLALCDPMDDSLPMEFSRQEYWSGLLSSIPGGLPDPEIEPTSPAMAGRFFTTVSPGKPRSLLPVCNFSQWLLL